ncbi:MAG: hypothetical protein K0Q79_2191 [Flavipsychrobacter sp.]|nr:hypothetical protein [Flavipsychrobacter sp.]
MLLSAGCLWLNSHGSAAANDNSQLLKQYPAILREWDIPRSATTPFALAHTYAARGIAAFLHFSSCGIFCHFLYDCGATKLILTMTLFFLADCEIYFQTLYKCCRPQDAMLIKKTVQLQQTAVLAQFNCWHLCSSTSALKKPYSLKMPGLIAPLKMLQDQPALA